MNFLQEEIIKKARVLNEDVLKVDSFLNHQVDPSIMSKIGKSFAEHFKDKAITKVITVETSGIYPALFTAQELGVPLLVCKKSNSFVLSQDYYCTDVFSFTHGNLYHMIASKKYISDDDNFLIIDDFLATGEATKGIVTIIEHTNAKIAGVGICIEKTFQNGRKELNKIGMKNIYSLVKIKSLNNNTLTFE